MTGGRLLVNWFTDRNRRYRGVHYRNFITSLLGFPLLIKATFNSLNNQSHSAIIVFRLPDNERLQQPMPRNEHTQNGEPICLIFSTKTFVEFPTVSGIGRAKVVDDPPAVPVF